MSAAFTIEIRGGEEVERKLRSLEGGFFRVAQAELKPLGDTYLSQLRADTPEGQGERPGRLRAAYQTQEFYSETQASYRITNETPHLRFVLRGRGPILAQRGRALRFVINGQVFFRKRVGPAKANDYPARTRRFMQGRIDRTRGAIAEALVRVYEGA